MDTLNNIAVDYIKIIKAFKNRTDVQDGTALGYRDGQDPNGNLRIENKPHSIGEGLTTTGYCVSASQALLYDRAFEMLLQKRGAQAKLVSIDIKEQFWGRCYNNVKNTWHTAILVNDSGHNFIVDITCSQFGDRYLEKFIWNFETWESTFRSPICKHVITDFDNNVLSFQATYLERGGLTDKVGESISNNEDNVNKFAYNFSKVVSLSEEEVRFISDYFANRINELNKKILLGNINSIDNKYIDKLNTVLHRLPFKKINGLLYSVLKFPNKKSCLKYVDLLHNNNYKNNQYLMFSKNLESACEINGIDTKNLNKELFDESNEMYLVIKLKDIYSISLEGLIDNIDTILPIGIHFNLDIERGGIYNANKLQTTGTFGVEPQKTNTIYMEALLV